MEGDAGGGETGEIAVFALASERRAFGVFEDKLEQRFLLSSTDVLL